MGFMNLEQRLAASGVPAGSLGEVLTPARKVFVDEVDNPIREPLVGRWVYLLKVDPRDVRFTFLVGYSSDDHEPGMEVDASSTLLRGVPEADRSRIDRITWVHAVRRIDAEPTPWPEPQAINIVFDGPPSHESGRFVEVETDDGRSIKVGEWVERPDGLWALRITRLPDLEPSETASTYHRTDPEPEPEPQPSQAPAVTRPQPGQKIRVVHVYKHLGPVVEGRMVYEGVVAASTVEGSAFVDFEGDGGSVQHEGDHAYLTATWEPLGWPENCVVYADYRSLDGNRPDAKDLLLIRRSGGWYSLSGPVRDDLPDVDGGVEFEISNIRMVHDGQVPS